MGDHDTWLSVLLPDAWRALEAHFAEGLARDWTWMMFQATHFTMTHVVAAVIGCLVILVATARYRAHLAASNGGVLPPARFTLAAMIDGFVGACYRYSADVMGEEDAERFLPFVGTLALFIFTCNIQGLVPGFLPATDTLKTNLALAVIVFVVYNVVGVWRNGLSYLAHFLGPKIGGFYWMAPLMLPIEIVSHFVRPVSLALRLMGNILADHKVLGVVMGLFALVVPVPFLLLGTLVAIVQTLVFTLLTIVYIGLALEHAEDH